jgi:hypothetical protein
MRPEQLASREHPVVQNPTDNKLDQSVGSTMVESAEDTPRPVNPDVSAVITDELLKLIRKLTEEKPKPKIQRFLTHPLVIVVISFLLSVPVGGFLTYIHTLRQQELARERSFSDELNKIRVQKIGEVWEQIDRTEGEVDNLLDQSNQAPDSNEKNVDNILRLVEEEVAVINKNRFWLGERSYNRIKNYLDINGRYALDKLLGPPGIDLGDTIKKREQAKQDILQVRSMFLKGEPEPR